MIYRMDKRYWLAFSNCQGIGPVRFQKLIRTFGSAKNAWEAPLSDLARSGIGQKMAEDVVHFRNTFSVDAYEERLQKLHVSYHTLEEASYPELLKQSNNPPFVLYTKGDTTSYATNSIIAVVGSRKITTYGTQVTELLVKDLVAAGCVIVSGLAMGVDAIAHASTLAAGGKTIAVLGSGVDYCTPRENVDLYDQILANGGAIISEAPLGQMPNKGSFPSRNRIIAGMSQGVLVTEGAQDSGSLITAHDAFANNRYVFAVPGPITSSVSQGPLSLIGKGATLVTTAKDILDVLQIRSTNLSKSKHRKGDSKEEQSIIDLLQGENLAFDELVRRTHMDSSQMGVLLSLLEMKGIIQEVEAGFFSLR